jgi:hypothetical protein
MTHDAMKKKKKANSEPSKQQGAKKKKNAPACCAHATHAVCDDAERDGWPGLNCLCNREVREKRREGPASEECERVDEGGKKGGVWGREEKPSRVFPNRKSMNAQHLAEHVAVKGLDWVLAITLDDTAGLLPADLESVRLGGVDLGVGRAGGVGSVV